jgi:DNA polymerase-3 subunit alpha
MSFKDYLDKGKNLMVNGYFKQRYNTEQYEFKVTTICLLETIKQALTKQLEINVHPGLLSKEMVEFIDQNVKANPGKSSLRFTIHEPSENLKVSMYTMEKGFSMNDEMAEFLLENPDLEISVALTG